MLSRWAVFNTVQPLSLERAMFGVNVTEEDLRYLRAHGLLVESDGRPLRMELFHPRAGVSEVPYKGFHDSLRPFGLSHASIVDVLSLLWAHPELIKPGTEIPVPNVYADSDPRMITVSICEGDQVCLDVSTCVLKRRHCRWQTHEGLYLPARQLAS